MYSEARTGNCCRIKPGHIFCSVDNGSLLLHNITRAWRIGPLGHLLVAIVNIYNNYMHTIPKHHRHEARVPSAQLIASLIDCYGKVFDCDITIDLHGEALGVPVLIGVYSGRCRFFSAAKEARQSG